MTISRIQRPPAKLWLRSAPVVGCRHPAFGSDGSEPLLRFFIIGIVVV
jgi:hypothetical protein